MLGVDALNEGEKRSLPYVGNVPTSRVEPNANGLTEADCEHITAALLTEVLQRTYFEKHTENLLDLFGLPSDLTIMS
ncbi:hypothetical protein [Stratiformator vulcanicus]|uniref:Uncharacterized protein n=1 Tax=Stratiformator vulcanicus TaxID=2527980 RepID=A0A517QWC7_9PLAN|nr:hypothetical protein [Stratiformator vulcanicus]QDT35972.1 hypothetical protein Pan189_03270 [Stratiformator vulcanicus]